VVASPIGVEGLGTRTWPGILNHCHNLHQRHQPPKPSNLDAPEVNLVYCHDGDQFTAFEQHLSWDVQVLRRVV